MFQPTVAELSLTGLCIHVTSIRLRQLLTRKMMSHEQTYLVGGIPTPLKNMKVSWDDYSQNGHCIARQAHTDII